MKKKFKDIQLFLSLQVALKRVEKQFLVIIEVFIAQFVLDGCLVFIVFLKGKDDVLPLKTPVVDDLHVEHTADELGHDAYVRVV